MKYESNSDQLIEQKAIALLARFLGARHYEFLPEFARGDALLLFEHDCPILVEFKRRYIRRRQYPSFQISTDKLTVLTEVGAALKFRVLILVEYDDEIGYYETDSARVEQYLRIIGGNRKRDPEEMSNIPIRDFTELSRGRRWAA